MYREGENPTKVTSTRTAKGVLKQSRGFIEASIKRMAEELQAASEDLLHIMESPETENFSLEDKVLRVAHRVTNLASRLQVPDFINYLTDHKEAMSFLNATEMHKENPAKN